MKNMINCLKYQYKQYLLSAKFVLPTVFYVSLMGFMYSIMPVDIVSIFSLMSLLLFMFMVWVSALCHDLEPEVSEQILILRMQSAEKYYCVRIFFYIGICALFTVFSLVYPILSHYLHGQALFRRSILPMDIVGGFFLMFLCSFVGSMVGNFFSPRIVPDAKARTVLTLIVAALSVVRVAVVAEIPIAKFVLWIVPPVSDLIAWFTKEEYFRPERLLAACLILFVYGVIAAVMWVKLSAHRKF